MTPQNEPKPSVPDPSVGEGEFDPASVHAFRSVSRPSSPHVASVSWHRGELPMIDGFRVAGIAGVGGLGVVFDAEQLHPRRRVAIKVIRPELVADERIRTSVLRRFEGEVAHASRLHHPYILPVYGAGVFADGGSSLPYLAMEFLDAPSLLAFCEERRLGRDARLELLAKVAEGVHYAHLNNVVHRDLKPSNIVVRANGLPAIRDFSLAWSRPQDLAAAERATASDLVACTFDYASPEQLVPGREVGPASDIYTLGVIGYELLLGALPYDCRRTDLVGVLTAISEQRRVPFSHMRRRCGADCAIVLARALDGDPTRRYSDAEAFANDLRAVVRGDRPTAGTPTLVDDLRRFAQRHRTAVFGASLLLLAVAGGTATTLWQANIAKRHAARAEERTERLAELAESVAFEITSIAERMPHSTLGRTQLLNKGVEVLEGIASEEVGRRERQISLAAAFLQQARALGDPTRPNVGESKRAAAIARKAIAVLDAQPTTPDDLAFRALRADALSVLGRILAAFDTKGSIDATFAAHGEYRSMLLDAPGSRDARLGAPYTLVIAAQISLEESGERLRAAFEPTRSLLEAAIVAAPAPTFDQTLVDSDAFDALARVAIALGHADQAMTLIEASDRLLRDSEHPNRFSAAARRVNPERGRAEVLEMIGAPEREIAQRRRAYERVVELIAGQTEPVEDTATELLAAVEYAECAMRTGLEVDRATEVAVRVARTWFARDPANVASREHLVDALRWRIEWLGRSNARGGERARLMIELAALAPPLAQPPPVTSELRP